MNSGTVIKGLSGLFGALLLLIGARWLIDPAGAAAGLDLPLLEGAARSTQIGDLAAFFLTVSYTHLTLPTNREV